MEKSQRGKIRANVEGRLFLLRRTARSAPHRTDFAHFACLPRTLAI